MLSPTMKITKRIKYCDIEFDYLEADYARNLDMNEIYQVYLDEFINLACRKSTYLMGGHLIFFKNIEKSRLEELIYSHHKIANSYLNKL